MFGLFTVTLNRDNLEVAIFSFLIFQIFIKLIFSLLDTERIKKYFKDKHDFISEDDEYAYYYESK